MTIQELIEQARLIISEQEKIRTHDLVNMLAEKFQLFGKIDGDLINSIPIEDNLESSIYPKIIKNSKEYMLIKDNSENNMDNIDFPIENLDLNKEI